MKLDLFLETCNALRGGSDKLDLIIDKYESNDSEYHSEFLGDELRLNLLNITTDEGKKGVIRYYIYQLHESISWTFIMLRKIKDGVGFLSLDKYTKIRVTFRDQLTGKESEKTFGQDIAQAYKCYEYYDILVNEIQISCRVFNLNFYELCDPLFINLKYIQTSMSDFRFDENNELIIEDEEQMQDPTLQDTYDSNDKDKDKDNDKDKEVYPNHVLEMQKEKIRLLYDLGVFDFFKAKYPEYFISINKIAYVTSLILGEKQTSIVSPLSYLFTNTVDHRNYPKPTAKTEAVMGVIKANIRKNRKK